MQVPYGVRKYLYFQIKQQIRILSDHVEDCKKGIRPLEDLQKDLQDLDESVFFYKSFCSVSYDYLKKEYDQLIKEYRSIFEKEGPETEATSDAG